MNLFGLAAIGFGAVLGAWLRWYVSDLLNPIFPTLPLGTLTANMFGGLLAGVALVIFSRHPTWPPEARLLVVTGFLGAFTTFSTFSTEVIGLFMRSEYLWGVATAFAHLIGALSMAAAGVYIATTLLKTWS